MLSRRGFLAGIAATELVGSLRLSISAETSHSITPVRFDVPEKACDCHVHVFGDPRRFLFAASRTYTPESASVDELQALHRALHLDRVVIVQPSVYGTDNSCMLDALKQIDSDARGIAVIDDQTSRKSLDEMERSRVRGVRINLGTAGQ